MEHFHIEVFVNEGGRVTIRQESHMEISLVVIPIDQLAAVIKALNVCRKTMLENGINASNP